MLVLALLWAAWLTRRQLGFERQLTEEVQKAFIRQHSELERWLRRATKSIEQAFKKPS